LRKLLCIASFAILAVYGQPRFEVVSVKPSPPDAIGSMNGGPLPMGPFNQTNHDPGRITWTNVRLGRVMQVAYDLPGDRISGPDWLRDDVVTIVATVPMGTSVSDFRLMLLGVCTGPFWDGAQCDGCGGGTGHGHIRRRSIATGAEVNAGKGARRNAGHRPFGESPGGKLAGFLFQLRPARV